jgi:hypothetical protein
VKPPSAAIICPVMCEEAGRQRKATNADISLGSPIRPLGVWDTISLIALSTPASNFYKKRNYNSDYKHYS